jgi:hypothetical protein
MRQKWRDDFEPRCLPLQMHSPDAREIPRLDLDRRPSQALPGRLPPTPRRLPGRQGARRSVAAQRVIVERTGPWLRPHRQSPPGGHPPRGTATAGISRRALLHRGGRAGVTLLLSACSAPSPAPTPTEPQPTAPKESGTIAPATLAAAPAAATTVAPAPTAAAKPGAAAVSGTTFAGAQLPTYIPSTLGARPDLPSTGQNVSDGFLTYPRIRRAQQQSRQAGAARSASSYRRTTRRPRPSTTDGRDVVKPVSGSCRREFGRVGIGRG